MNFPELSEKTRSFRRFDERREISTLKLKAIILSAGLAPCASNLQRLRYSIITEEKERDILFSGIGWAGYLTDWEGPEPGEKPPAYIVIHAPKEEKPFTGIDVGIAASYLVLSAAADGIGSCMLLNFNRESVNSVAPAPGYTASLVVAFGYPGETVRLEKNSEKIKYWRD
jgi:nitroreductase